MSLWWFGFRGLASPAGGLDLVPKLPPHARAQPPPRMVCRWRLLHFWFHLPPRHSGRPGSPLQHFAPIRQLHPPGAQRARDHLPPHQAQRRGLFVQLIPFPGAHPPSIRSRSCQLMVNVSMLSPGLLPQPSQGRHAYRVTKGTFSWSSDRQLKNLALEGMVG